MKNQTHQTMFLDEQHDMLFHDIYHRKKCMVFELQTIITLGLWLNLGTDCSPDQKTEVLALLI